MDGSSTMRPGRAVGSDFRALLLGFRPAGSLGTHPLRYRDSPVDTPDDIDRPLDVDRLMDDLKQRAHRPTHGRPLFEPGPEELHVTPREIVADSPRRFIGPAVSKGKRAVTRTMQPVLDDLAAQVNASLDHIVSLHAELEDLRAAIAVVPDSADDLARLRARVDALDAIAAPARLARLEATPVPGAATAHPVPPIDPGIAALAGQRARIDDLGTERLSAYWAVIDPAMPVLDLSWTSDEPAINLQGRGVDVRCVHPDATTVAARRDEGLRADVGDPLGAIADAPAGSLGGIVGVGLGDHLSGDHWLALPRLAAAALAPGGGLVLEMINSTTPAALALRSRDPSLAPPIHPETVAFLLRSAGFDDVEVRFLGAFPDEDRAPLADDPDWFERRLNEMASVINRLVVGQPLVAVLARR